MKTRIIAPAILALGSLSANAAPIEFDTPDAHVIVIRPADQWSPRPGPLKSYKAGIEDKRYSLFIRDADDNIERLGGGGFGVDSFKSAAMQTVVAKAKETGWASGGFSAQDVNYVGIPVSVTPETLIKRAATQRFVYQQLIYKRGGPEQEQSAADSASFWGNALGVLTTIAGVATLGVAGGVNATVGSGASFNIASLPTELRGNTAVVWPSDYQYTGIKTADLRFIKGSERAVFGEIIIAYKGEKTPDKESEALGKALVALVGFDRNLDDLKAAQKEDYDRRKAIWDECVAAGKCGQSEKKESADADATKTE